MKNIYFLHFINHFLLSNLIQNFIDIEIFQYNIHRFAIKHHYLKFILVCILKDVNCYLITNFMIMNEKLYL